MSEVTERMIGKLPVCWYTLAGFLSVEVVPSPKDHKQEVTDPVAMDDVLMKRVLSFRQLLVVVKEGTG